MTGLHRRLTPRAIFVAFLGLCVGFGCPNGDSSPEVRDVPPIVLPPPLVGGPGNVETRPLPKVVSSQWRLSQEAQQPEHPEWLRLLYGQDLRAEIEACGCPGSPTGGFSRRATVLKQARAVLPSLRLVEGPNALSRALTGLELLEDQDRARARLVLELLAEVGTEAFFPGQADLAMLPPGDLARDATALGLPVVVSNMLPSATPLGWRKALLWEVGDKRVMLVGLLGTPRTELENRVSPTTPPGAAVATLREKHAPDVVIGFTSARDRERRRWEAQGDLGVDVLFVPFEREEGLPERWRDNRYELTADPLGRGLRRLDLVFSGASPGVRRQPDAENAPRSLASQEETWLRLSRDRSRLLELVAQGEDPEVKVRGYDGVLRSDPGTSVDGIQGSLAQVALERDLSLTRAGAKRTGHHVVVGAVLVLPADVSEEPGIVERIAAYQETWLEEIQSNLEVTEVEDGRQYGSVDTCVGCHQAEYGRWGRTAHVSAYKTLREHAEHRNPDCLECHATGFGKPGGFAEPGNSGLLNVQCEACHGPMAQHAREAGSGGGSLKPSAGLVINEATCVTCHDPVNSPEFNYETYLPPVAHGMKRPGGGSTQ